MLVRILKSRVAETWDTIAPMIEMTLPEWTTVTEKTLVNVLESMLEGSLVGWFVCPEADQEKIYGLVTTHFSYDAHGGKGTGGPGDQQQGSGPLHQHVCPGTALLAV